MIAVSTANAQTPDDDQGGVTASANAWLDLFVGPDGDVVYPQYMFRVATENIVVTGYGFWERAPNEPDFTNHVNTVTYQPFSALSLRAETGGRTRDFEIRSPRGGAITIPPAAFFQVGPQVNLHRLGKFKGLDYMVLSYLPHLAGIRPNNTILAGGTTRLPVMRGIAVSVEGYRRFFPEGADYAEYWFLVHPTRTNGHMGFGVFFLQDGRAKSLGFGVRLEPL